MNVIKKIIPDMETFASNDYSFERAKTLVQIFYYFQIALSVMNLIKLGAADPGRAGFQPLWPVFWVNSIGYTEARLYLFTSFLITSFIGAIFWRYRIARVISFLGLWQLHALESSFKGQANFFIYPWLYTSFLFMFLPKLKEVTLAIKKQFLLIFWAAQAMVLLMYSMAGAFKIYTGLNQLSAGEVSGFHPSAFAYQIIVHNALWNRQSFFGELLVKNVWIAWPMYLGAIYFELFALYAAVKPELQRLFSFMMIILHTGAILFMGIPFWEHIIINTILLLNSPFAKDDTKFSQVLITLPLFGPFFKVAFRTLNAK